MSTYYVRADGTVTSANKANATSDASASTSLNVSNHNSATFAAGDTIIISGSGGNYTTAIIPPSSGSAGNPIYYTASNNPVIVVSGNSLSFYINGKNYITVSGLNIGNTNAAASSAPLYLAGTSDHLSFSNLTLLSTNGHLIYNTGTQTNLTINGITGTLGAGYAILSTTAGPHSGLNVSNFTVTNGKGFRFDNLSSSSFSNITVNSSTTNAFYISSGNTITISDSIANDVVQTSFYDTGSTAITWTRCTSNRSGAGAFGTVNSSGNRYNYCTGSSSITQADFIASGSSNDIIYTKCEALNSTGDGFAVANGSTANNITYKYCVATGNGTKSSNSIGDGFTAHVNNFNIKYWYCIAKNNTASGWSVIGDSTGEIYNCLSINNAGNWSTTGGVDQIRGGIYIGSTGSWTAKNNIGYNNYPREILLTSTSNADMNYNCYYHPADSNIASIDGGTSNITWSTYHATYEANSINSDPKFRSDSDFHLLKGSPCINSGTYISGPTTDFDGNKLPLLSFGFNPDIGVYDTFKGAAGTLITAVYTPYASTLIPAGTGINICTASDNAGTSGYLQKLANASGTIECPAMHDGTTKALLASSFDKDFNFYITQWSYDLGTMRSGKFNNATLQIDWGTSVAFDGQFPVDASNKLRVFYGGDKYPIKLGKLFMYDRVLTDNDIKNVISGSGITSYIQYIVDNQGNNVLDENGNLLIS